MKWGMMKNFFNSLYADLCLPAIIVVLHFGAPGMKEFSDCTLQFFGYTPCMNTFMNRENTKYQVNFYNQFFRHFYYLLENCFFYIQVWKKSADFESFCISKYETQYKSCNAIVSIKFLCHTSHLWPSLLKFQRNIV